MAGLVYNRFGYICASITYIYTVGGVVTCVPLAIETFEDQAEVEV